MPSAQAKSVPTAIPDGYAAVALTPDAKAAPIRVAVLVRRQPDPVVGHFVVLRDTVDAQVLLGCLVDGAGQVHQWLEIWIQNVENLARAVPTVREAATNPILDERFMRHVKAFENLDRALLIRTPWETTHPAPLFVDTATMEPVHPGESAGGPRALCQDDALLTQKNLPAFTKSIHRYLCVPGDPGSPLIPVTADAPTNSNTVALTEITGPNPTWIPLNPGGGLMMLRLASPIAFEPYVDMLAGGTWNGILSGRSALHLDGLPDTQESGETSSVEEGAGRLFMGAHGKAGRFAETFHLKLRLLADAVTSVRTMTAATQRPVLNLTGSSFQIRLAHPGAGKLSEVMGLPLLWTAQATLVDPGDAIALAIEATESQYFLRAANAPTTVYQPATISKSVQGRGSVRIRKLLPEAAGATLLEGTFATQEKMEPARSDLLWLRLNVAAGRIDLYGHVEKDAALAAGEWRFRTIRQRFSEAAAAQLKAAEGVPIQDVPFEIVPLLSTPCDLYALAVLAIRTLLVNPQTTLAVAVDEVLSLARQIASEHKADVPLGQRIRAVFERDARFITSLGPNRLARDEMTPAEAFDLVAPELWLDTLAAIVRMLPGIGPDSICRDFGDDRAGGARGGLHKAFDATLVDLESLLLRSRSLIVIDWRFNREIHAVLRQFSAGTAGTQTSAPARR